MNQNKKILITGKLHKVVLELFNNPPNELAPPHEIEVVYLPDAKPDVILEQIKDAHILITRSETTVDAALLRSAPNLRLVARAAVGYGNIDCPLATELGILVVNTPGKNTNSAAELTFGLMLSLIRKIPQAHHSTSHGGWNRHIFTGTELSGKTLGILGLGHVGHRVAKFARGFDMKLMAYDPYISDDIFRKNHCERKNNLEDLLEASHILSVHTPLNKETKNMITQKELYKMKQGALIINAARGGIINEDDLLESLNNNHIAGAAIDTFKHEPHPHPLLVAHERVVVTPHIGASTEEAQYRTGRAVAIQVLKFIRGEIVDYPVNLPHVSTFTSGNMQMISVLAEKLSLIAMQILEFQPHHLKLQILSDIKKEDLEILRLSVMKGFLKTVSDEYVSHVNAERLFTKRGFSLELHLEEADSSSQNELTLEILGEHPSDRVSVGAFLYNKTVCRLCSINEFMFEIELNGDLLVFQNHDRPGVIGEVGSFLATYDVNIAQFELSRNKQGGMAMSLVRTDSELTWQILEGLKMLKNIVSVKVVSGL